MNALDFMTTYCSHPPKSGPEWRPLYDDAAHGRRPADEPFDEVLEMAAYQSLAGEPRSERAAYLLDVLNHTPEPDNVPEAILGAHLELLSESDLTDAFADVGPDYVVPTATGNGNPLHLSKLEIAEALPNGDDPLALNFATATYESPYQGRADALLAIAQIAVRFESQTAVDRFLRPGSATVILCERKEDVAHIHKGLLRFRARPVVNDFDDPKPVPPATIIVLDRDRHGIQIKRALEAVSEAPALVVITSDASQLQGCLAHLPMFHIDAPSRDVVLTVIADVSSATGQISASAVRATLPGEAQMRLLSREALLLAFRERGPMRVAQRMSGLAREAGGARAAARQDAERLARAISAAAGVVVSYLAGAEVPIAVSMTQNAALVHTDPNTTRHTTSAVSGRLAALLAGEALHIIRNGNARAGGPPYPAMRLQAKWLALSEAQGRLDSIEPNSRPDAVAMERTFSGDKTLRSKVSSRLDGAQKQATAILKRNLVAVDLIVGHLITDGAVASETLVDLFVMCEERKW
jgi:hypothetical protein